MFVVKKWLLCFLIVILWSGQTVALAQEANEPALVLGKVEDQAGSPVSQAKFWLVGGSYGNPKVISETNSNAAGEFEFTDLDEEVAFASPGNLFVLVRHPTSGIGWYRGFHNKKRKPVLVRLQPTATFKGQLVDVKDQPLAGVKISPVTLVDKRLHEGSSNFADLFNDEFSTTTDDEGKFSIAGLPSTGSVICDFDLKEAKKSRVIWNLGQTCVTKIRSSVSLSGQVEIPDDVKLPTKDDFSFGQVFFRGRTSFLTDGTPTTELDKASSTIMVEYDSAIDQLGRFQTSSLLAGKYSVSASFSSQVRLTPVSSKLEIGLEPVTDFKLATNRACLVTGRVIGCDDKEPVPGAVLQIMKIVEGGLIYGQSTQTDQDGKFSFVVGKGEIMIKVEKCPAEFVATGNSLESDFAKSRTPRFEVTKDMQWPDLELDGSTDVTLEVVDENGEPAVGAVVKIVTTAGYLSWKEQLEPQETDSSGKYVAPRVAVNDTLPIRIRTATAISEPGLNITPEDFEGPIRVELSPDHGFRYRVRVVDKVGDPIAGARVTVATFYPWMTKYSDRGMSQSGSAGGGITDQDGYFQSGPLWPDLSYRINAGADGYSRAESAFVDIKPKPGEVADLKPLVLKRVLRTSVTGVVVDENKNPIKNVRVFAAGKDYKLAESRTDAAGKFRLVDIHPELKFAFAQIDNYRLGGVRLGRKEQVEIVLRSNDSPAKGIREIGTRPQQERLQSARELLEKAWSLPISPRNTSRISILEVMTKIDTQRASEMAVTGGATFEYVTQTERASLLAKENPQAAMELLRAVRSKRPAIMMALKLATRFANSGSEADKKKAIEFARLAVDLAGDDFERYCLLPPLLSRLGEHEEAKLIVEKSLEAAKLDNLADKRNEYYAVHTAIALAPYDYEKAKSIVDLVADGYSKTDAQAKVALAIAASDPDKAIKEISELKGDSNAPTTRDRARLTIALKLVHADLHKGIDLVYACEEADNRSQALGWLAVEVAKLDKPKSWKLIDDAIKIHIGSNHAFQSWSNFGGASAFGATLAYQAKQTEYPDMESIVWFARAAALANSNRGQTRLDGVIKSARILALVDKFAARDLLNSVEQQTDQLGRADGGLSLFDQWVQAWLMVDYGRGVKLIDEELTEFKSKGDQDPLRYGHGDVLRLLIATGNDQFKLLIEDTGIWDLDE